MIYELRIYTCYPGSVQRVLELWQTRGQAMIEPYMKMVGQWIGESGTANQIYTLWEFESFDHRQQARASLLQHQVSPNIWLNVAATINSRMSSSCRPLHCRLSVDWERANHDARFARDHLAESAWL